ncbi:MAG TPA: hypothetical protein VGL39_17825 [Jatrophihabitantaceae bacterium]|jgi:hypothetical protein
MTFEQLHTSIGLERERNAPQLTQLTTDLQTYADAVGKAYTTLSGQADRLRLLWTSAAASELRAVMSRDLEDLRTMHDWITQNVLPALSGLPAAVTTAADQVDQLAKQPREPHLVSTPNPYTSSSTLMPGWTEQDLERAAHDVIDPVMLRYQTLAAVLASPPTWSGERPSGSPSANAAKAKGPAGPGGAGGVKAPGGGAGGAAGGAKSSAKAPAAGGAGSPSAAGGASGSDPSAAGDPSASDPSSVSDPNAMSPSGSDPNQSGLNNIDPSTFDPGTSNPNLPNDPNISNPNVPNINVPQLAGNPSTIQLPPNSSTTPPSIKIPDLNLPAGSNSAGGGTINLPSVLPPGTTPSQPGTGGPSSPSPGTSTAGGNAPKPVGLAGEPAAAAAAKTSGMPYLPPPMGGMGGGGRQGGGGVKPGTAEQAGGPELGALGGPAGKPIEEIGVPARLRGRGAAGRSERPTRPARPRRADGAGSAGSAGKGSAKGAALSSGPTVDDSGEVLDEQLWRVEPPAMSDE